MKFNLLKRRKSQVLNYEGEKAIRLSPKMELYTAVVTAGLGNYNYSTEEDRLNRIKNLIPMVDPVFVAKLAVYARTKMYLRSIPLVLVTELAKIHNGDSLISKTIVKVIGRADEITELLACYVAMNKRSRYKKLNKLSKQIQKGLANSFNKFDEYQFAKYDRPAEITLRDALFLVRPKADSYKQQLLFNKIVDKQLNTPYTWEAELSELGQRPFSNQLERDAAFCEKWEELITSGKLGYMALLRNLRNILEIGVSSDSINTVGLRIRSENEVAKSKQLPFRFLSAYREIKKVKSEYSSFILDCLEDAATTSVSSLKGFDLNTKALIACDVSASMYAPLSKKSSIRYYDVGLLLGMLMSSKSKNVVTGIFGDKWKEIALPSSQILANTEYLNRIEGSVGYSTNGFKVLESLIKKGKVMDKIMLFTDAQMWDSTRSGKKFQDLWKTYKATMAPSARLYLFDLTGYGNAPLKIGGTDVFLIAGWSDKIFDVLNALEDGETSLSEIDCIEI
ncbi:MAG: TROVE domain-containing protein [Balneolaceae bacterium]|nr:TROVE domain-containing protein [Balneolaceae bacterium]MBO6545465.1 TROVE domain-containing protein [Balneolaceae bacterium]MBO6646861.1 TROVE domain-containing protein [Balneolaceae bacterium]